MPAASHTRYDQIGNRLTETADGGPADSYLYVGNGAGNTPILDEIQLGAGGTRTYTYGPAGHLEEIDDGTAPLALTSNAEGRPANLDRPAFPASAELTYDGRSFLTLASGEALRRAPSPEGPGAIFADDFESGNFCAWSSTAGAVGDPCPPQPVTTVAEPLYSSDGRLHLLAGDQHPNSVLVFYFAGRPVALLEPGTAEAETWTYLTTDHLGTPIAATDDAGVLEWQGGFEPFGEDFSGAQSAGIFLRLPGQWVDSAWEGAVGEEGLFYNVHRWLEAGTGKYARTDPLGIQGDANPYAYAASRPLLLTDPLGLKSRVCCTPIAGGIAGIARHCFIETADDSGKSTTRGLHGIGPIRGRIAGGLGCRQKDDGFDKGALGNPRTDCGEWNEDCGADECVVRETDNYPLASVYSLLGPNSNTFAGTVARSCGLDPAPSVGAQTPGWGSAPAPSRLPRSLESGLVGRLVCPERRRQ